MKNTLLTYQLFEEEATKWYVVMNDIVYIGEKELFTAFYSNTMSLYDSFDL